MKFVLALCFSVLLSGCEILPPSRNIHDFGPLLQTHQINTKHISSNNLTVTAPKWLLDNRIQYRLIYVNPTQVRYYSLDRWIAPPSELFEQLVSSELIEDPNIILTIQLQRFEQQFSNAQQSKGVMKFTATRTLPHLNRAPISQDFYLEQTCLTPNAQGAVTALSDLARRATNQLKFWLETN